MSVDKDLIDFLLTLTFSFLIGLEMKSYQLETHPDDTQGVGTVRTYSFLGMLGYLFYRLDPQLLVYVAGFTGFTVLYAIYYSYRVQKQGHSILSYLLACVVYSMGPLTVQFPFWQAALVFVLVIFILNARGRIRTLSQAIRGNEMETLGKMVLLSAVILPLLPDRDIIPYLPLSPFKIWLAVVVISAISYGGYIAQRYFFHARGIFLTGIIGGTYSSTATTVVLAKKAREHKPDTMITASIIAATAVMYLRLVVVAYVFNTDMARYISTPFLILSLTGFGVAYYYYRLSSLHAVDVELGDENPLELGTAIIFAGLFVIMIMVTHFVTDNYGSGGLKLLSFMVGFTDIDPFILSLLTGKYAVSNQEIHAAIIISAGSNNILKGFYALWFGGRKKTFPSFAWLMVLGLATIVTGLIPWLP